MKNQTLMVFSGLSLMVVPIVCFLLLSDFDTDPKWTVSTSTSKNDENFNSMSDFMNFANLIKQEYSRSDVWGKKTICFDLLDLKLTRFVKFVQNDTHVDYLNFLYDEDRK
jgi:hypothetical protein